MAVSELIRIGVGVLGLPSGANTSQIISGRWRQNTRLPLIGGLRKRALSSLLPYAHLTPDGIPSSVIVIRTRVSK